MNSGSLNPSLGEADTRFLTSLPPGEEGVSQQEMYRFVRWYGEERALAALKRKRSEAISVHHLVPRYTSFLA